MKVTEPISLKTLEAVFRKYWTNDEGTFHGVATSISEAHGVSFLCPKCFVANGMSAVGTHQVICWFTGKVPDDAAPGPGRWNPQGNGLEDLSFVAPGSTSVLLYGGCGWHGFVQKGKASIF